MGTITLTPGSSVPVPAMVEVLIKPYRYIHEDADAFVTFARRGIEAVVSDLVLARSGRVRLLEDMLQFLRSKGVLSGKVDVLMTVVQRLGNRAVHPQGRKDEPLTLADADLCERAYTSCIEWFFRVHHKTAVPVQLRSAAEAGRVEPELRVVCLDDVRAEGIDVRQLLAQWLTVDFEVFNDIRQEDEGIVEYWLPIVEAHPDTWRLLMDRFRRIVGYWHFIPLFDDAYRIAREGRQRDGMLKLDDIPHLGIPGCHNAYFMTIATRLTHRSVRTFALLFGAFAAQLETLAENGVFFDEFCANAWTNEGLALCKTLGMGRLGDHCERGAIFARSMRHMSEVHAFGRWPHLVSLYRDYFRSRSG
jgi:hypothetical protein